MSSPQTVFGSLDNYSKGGVEIINDNPKHYVFSNVFEVANKFGPYERVAVGKNLRYVIEAARAEGNSPWYSANHDESALVMDGEVEIHFIKPDQAQVPSGKEGAVKLAAEPKGKKMGWVKARRGHQALLPAGLRVSVPQRQTRRAVDPGHPRRLHARALGRHLPEISILERKRRI